MTNSLIFHYQPVLHNSKDGIFLHEAFSTRMGILYSVNPSPVEINGDTEEEVEEVCRTMESDSSKYKAVRYSKLNKEMDRWVDEVEISSETPLPSYEDEEELEPDYYGKSGEVLDLVDYINKNKR